MNDLNKVLNVNIAGFQELITPARLKEEVPVADEVLHHVLQQREILQAIMDKKDARRFVVVGPCSIHDPVAALEYAHKLHALSKKVQDKLLLVMRVYFEKPRTTVGWKGLINDPYLDDSFRIEEGLKIARKLLIDINQIGLATGTEALDPITPQYLSELITWSAIGARTAESQTHREMSSGLSMPVGIKNGTDGGIEVAINALQSMTHPHHFLGINSNGQVAKFSTRGNAYGHVVLRGGSDGPNYSASSIADCEQKLEAAGLKANIVVDCSHANSNKDHNRQPAVLEDCAQQIQKGNSSIIGFMIESNLFAGNQKITDDPKDLAYGVSITDKCVDWETTEKMILELSEKI
ncbi:MAG: 3-deoxy-7-phosphoheptulonate synthase [Deltaproteobacteria bacterium]|nr:3-deoxy-7-phosphoheptulonate synthase [Deltaproteobacteria bacterium]